MSTQTDLNSLPSLGGDYALDAQQIAEYRKNGHIALRGVASPEEVAAFKPVIVEAATRYTRETRPLEERDTYGKAFLQTGHLWHCDEAVKRFTQARRFAKIAADLMGVEAVALYNDQALFKEPGGGLTPWHQDQQYWPLDTDNAITMWMPLVPVPAEVGSMNFGSGSHELGYLGPLSISDESERRISELLAQKEIPISNHGSLEAGDATFHAGWTLHGAPGNPTALVRQVMTIIFMDAAARTLEPDSRARWDDFNEFFPDQTPGCSVVGEMTPLIYRR